MKVIYCIVALAIWWFWTVIVVVSAFLLHPVALICERRWFDLVNVLAHVAAIGAGVWGLYEFARQWGWI